MITVESAARLIGRSEMRSGEAINRLEAAGILRQRNVGRQRYRVFEAADVVDLLTGLERALASPSGDTPRHHRAVAFRVGCRTAEMDSDAVLLRTLIFLSQASWVTQEASGTPAILQGGVLHGRLVQRL